MKDPKDVFEWITGNEAEKERLREGIEELQEEKADSVDSVSVDPWDEPEED